MCADGILAAGVETISVANFRPAASGDDFDREGRIRQASSGRVATSQF